MKNNIFNDNDDLSNDFNSDEYFNDNISNSFNSYFDQNLTDNLDILDKSDSLRTNFDEPKRDNNNPYAISFDFEKSLKLTGKASAVDRVEVGSVEAKNDPVKVDVLKANVLDVDASNKTNPAGPGEVTVFGNTKMTVLPTKENNVGFGEAPEANNLTHKQPNLLTKQKDVVVGTTTQLDIEKDSLASEASSVTIAEEKANQLEAKLRAKLNKLGDRKRKLLGYSMITIGVVLSSLLIVTTFARLEFKDVLVQATSTSKDTLGKILAKSGTAKPDLASNSNTNSNANSNADSNSNTNETTKSVLGADNNSSVPANDTANNNSNSNVIINLSDSSSYKSNSKNEVGNKALGDWQAISSLLASTPNRRKLAAKTLGIDKGEWILACFSVGCGDCDRAATKLNQLKINGNLGNGNVLAITTANQSEANLWQQRLGLGFEVRSVSSQTFDDTGAVFLPTIIKLKNGISIGAKESLEGN